MKKMSLLPIALELVGIAAVGGGIGIEIATRAGLGHLLITSGSCLIALGGIVYAKILHGGK